MTTPALQQLQALVEAVPPVDEGAATAAEQLHAGLAKPPGSLGRLEEVGAHLSGVTGLCPPPTPVEPMLLVAAGDHGVHAQQVTPWPQQLTTAIAQAVADGVAASGPMARAAGVKVRVVDVGMLTALAPHASVRDHRVRAGTDDLTLGPAMSGEEATRAVLAGVAAAREAIDDGADLILLGEVGIANTTPTACLVAALTGRPAASVTGPGAGSQGAFLQRKVTAVEAALSRHGPDREPLGLLASLGGLEHAALVGMMLAAAEARIPALLDGVTTVAAALVAVGLCPPLAGHLLASHRSTEPAATAALDHLGLAPLLDLGLRLGEGTGALAATPLVVAAARVMHETATLDDLV